MYDRLDLHALVRAAVVISTMLFVLIGPASAESVTFTDKSGRSITLKAPVERAVLFETYELLPALGAWDRVVGLSRHAFENDLLRATQPGLRERIADVGGMADMNVEYLLTLHPDVIIGWGLSSQAITFLEAKGIPVVLLDPQSVEDLEETLRIEGVLFGASERADRTIAAMKTIIDGVSERTRRIPDHERRVGLWMMGKPTVVGARRSVAARALEIAGMRNAAASEDRPWVEVSAERILAWKPDVVFICGSARFEVRDILEAVQWRSLPAVRDGAIWKTPRWSSWSPRLAPMILWMASKAYPAMFDDAEVASAIDHFFRDVYGISYSQVAPLDP
ncbi:MAG: ABC transporter substrate-binding protein [Phyllobacteriaceae bacterium]|nr:ABC transporter substrate-binding protein [Phyllobacteriaceae bacterium]